MRRRRPGPEIGRLSQTSMCLVMVGVPILPWALLSFAVRRQKAKIPNASYWFAASRRGATVRFLFTQCAWFGVISTVFLGCVFWLVSAANAGAPAHPVLEPRQMHLALGALLAVVATWVTVLNMRFSRETA